MIECITERTALELANQHCIKHKGVTMKLVALVGAGRDADPQQPVVPAEQPEALPAALTRRELPESAAPLAHLRALLWLLHLLLWHEAGVHQHPPLQRGFDQVPTSVLCVRASGH